MAFPFCGRAFIDRFTRDVTMKRRPAMLVQQKLRVPGLNSFLMKNVQIVYYLRDALR